MIDERRVEITARGPSHKATSKNYLSRVTPSPAVSLSDARLDATQNLYGNTVFLGYFPDTSRERKTKFNNEILYMLYKISHYEKENNYFYAI